MPHHSQEYRWVNGHDYLDCSKNRIEILIGEVKNYAKLDNVKFNKGLRNDRESIKQLNDWLGIYEKVTDDQIDKFEANLNLHTKETLNGFSEFNEDLPLGKFKIKFTFFCPSLPKWGVKGFKYIHGEEMIDFVWDWLNETNKIKTCSRRCRLWRLE